jgi:hypothetical protein
MKTTAFILCFLLIVTFAFARRPVSFDKFALDDDKTATMKTIEKEYKGKYTVDEWGGYEIAVGANKTVIIYFEGDSISHIYVEHKNMKYSDYLDLVNKLVLKHGEPKGSYVDEEIYITYWWATDPLHDVRVSISLDAPYTVTEMVFYGK